MGVIHVLEKYIDGKIKEGNSMLANGVVVDLCSEPKRNIHKLLIAFKEKSLLFRVLPLPVDVEQAARMLENANDPAEQYFYALYLLKYKNPVVAEFVDEVLERVSS